MRLVLMHVDDLERRAAPWQEEVALIVPGGDRTAIMVPFAALDAAVPLMAEVVERLDEQRCDACGELLAAIPADGHPP